ncbi:MULTISPECIES: DUF192 domain-containing protein [Sphingobium]|uniref:DUF192 domain-containing protein n=2 Tax=Sphingobium cupriresistens TaxID=1132417 RepID=A0A0J7XZS4_9SPHN|nr:MULTISPECIES: DUF192 domain-containing protein [Sphingobium]KMS57191.1 hypothetical protein V473_02900 [Sphingobium cupriresistens LL01]MBJ7376438.1 DUF192 domain-containing protein [Sphingobium sp.]RYM08874.1 DUF192 domain-containing protein [Sphingobium cupriresistens]WCP14192.1 hypothetical protein sphantq_02636 [Sphingobium sp. AntQ-1]
MIRFPALLALCLLAACSSRQPAPDNSAQAQAADAMLPVVIRTAKGGHRFDVEVAATPQAQEKGLMFRKELAPDGGMLFPMDPPRTASFWMKDTLIPLDMLFIHTDGTIAFLKSNAQPYSRIPVSAGVPVAAVLELAGGRAAALGIAEGDVVNWGGCAVPGGKVTTDRNFCPAAPR